MTRVSRASRAARGARRQGAQVFPSMDFRRAGAAARGVSEEKGEHLRKKMSRKSLTTLARVLTDGVKNSQEVFSVNNRRL
jgi:hypothetical protein